MSYPRQLETLIIEDDPKVKDLYEAVFADIRSKDPSVLAPRYAFSYDDAFAEFERPRMFHLVILDLCLPERRGLPEAVGVDHGMGLVEKCEKRDPYPVIGLLIVTGNAGKTEQTSLRERLQRGFSYGQLIVKGGDSIALLEEIEKAIKHIRAYSDVGLHVHDGVAEKWPVLSPREEDLLRRAALLNKASGYDVAWWSAEYSKPTGQHAAFRGWTKVLMGHFLLADGRGRSRPMFCKLMPGTQFDVVAKDAEVLEQKLSHIKVKATVIGGSRSLLITEKTGDSATAPISLATFLSRPTVEISAMVAAVAAHVLTQTEALGELRVDMVPLRSLLWPNHDDVRILEACTKHAPREVPLELSSLQEPPLPVLAAMRANGNQFPVELRDCLHGDLNITNIAVDAGPDTKGYIFDASGIGSGPATRDLAMLEISSLLHLPGEVTTSMVLACGGFLYGTSFLPPVPVAVAGADRAANTLALVRAIRNYASGKGHEAAYALCLFDQVLVQVGGLAWPSGNKISAFSDAVLLAELVAGWVKRVAPVLIGVASTAASAAPHADPNGAS